MSDKPDVAALIARLRVATLPYGVPNDDARQAADALQSQQERIAELERLTEPGQINWAERCGRAETRAETAEARVAELEDAVRGWEACLVRANEERDIFKAERDALRKDAERYREVRNLMRIGQHGEWIAIMGNEHNLEAIKRDFDDEIDAAIAARKP